MSYILDALKKSEQERGHGNIPSVQTVHTSSLNYHNKKALWPYVLIAAVLLNIVAILYFYLDKDKIPSGNTTTSEANNSQRQNIQAADDSIVNENRNEPAASVSLAATNIPSQQNIAHRSETIAAEKLTPASAMAINNDADASRQNSTRKNETTIEDNTDVIDFHDLPDTIKQQLPSIIVSAHVYSSNPLQRSIVINNNFLEEGEYILDDLILHEITPDGAILYYQGTRFHYPVVSGWQ